MSSLPNTWIDVELSEVAQIIRGVTYKREQSADEPKPGLLPVLRATNISGVALDFDNLVYVPAENISAAQLLLQGDVVVASSSGSKEIVGKAGSFLRGSFIGSFGAFCTGLRPTSLVSPIYFQYYFQTPSYRKSVSELSAGSNINNLKTGDLAAQRFPLPPSAEQTRIVAKLEELLSDLDAAVAELKAVQKKLGQYRQSLLKAAVEGADSGKPYPKRTLGELVISIGQGWSPKCERESATDNDQWAVMKTTAIQPLEFDGTHNKTLPADLMPRVNLELKSGDLLVTRAGPRNRVGITCLVRITRPKLILCDKAYRIRCDEERIDPGFLNVVLNAPHMVQRIDELKTGISDSGLNLTQDRFFTLEIPLPTIEKQRTIVKRINAQVALIQGQEQSIDFSLKQSAAQRQNILRAAFSGQLVPQDPNDEPASVLLERIRAERAARDALKQPRGRKIKERN